MKNIFLPAFVTAALLATISLPAATPDPAAINTVIITANDNMKFNLTRIDAKPGQKIRVQLTNTGTLPKEVMAHNWILLKLGADPTAYATKALTAKDEGYQPKSLADEVLASIPLVGAGQTGESTFEAPAIPGSYPFFCSFPAHCQIGMRGDLVVK
jgi:azurin